MMSVEPVSFLAPLIDQPEVATDERASPAYFLPERTGVSADGKPIYASQQAAEQLTRGGYSWNAPGVLGAGVTITYGFRASRPSEMPEDTSEFSRFNFAQIIGAERALAAWSDVANITFVRADAVGDYTNNAQVLFSNYVGDDDSDAAAFAYYPEGPFGDPVAGDIWVDNTLYYNANPVVGDYGQQVLVHEIGHALGLRHPSDYNAGDSEEEITYAANAGYFQDSRQYTIMSYFGSRNTGADPGTRFGAAPQMDDIAAIQRLYGPNLNTRTGDTTYGFNSNADRPWFETSATVRPVFSVWDAGGTDTFDFSGYSEVQNIDLRQEAFSNVGGLRYSVSIAVGAVIENAFGGAGSDIITGNDSANVIWAGSGDDGVEGGGGSDLLVGQDGRDELVGGGGDDRLHGWDGDDVLSGEVGADDLIGGGGDDLLFGGEGDDQLAGYAGADQLWGGDGDDAVYGWDDADLLVGQAGADQLWGGEGSDRLDGWAGNDLLVGQGGADELWGGEGDDRLDGWDGADLLIGQEGADVLWGGAGDDRLHGWDGDDLLVGQEGADELIGGAGDDRLHGWGEADVLQGEAGRDELIGGDGDDFLVGGFGADRLTGGAGADRFVFGALTDSSAGGSDLIFDFRSVEGDRLDLSGIDADASAVGDQAFRLVSALSGQPGQAALSYNSVEDATTLVLDVNGDGLADFALSLSGAVTSDAGWLL